MADLRRKNMALRRTNSGIRDALRQERGARKQAAERLMRVCQLGTLGISTAGLTHDFRGVLNVIMGQVEILRFSGQPGAKRAADVLERAGRQGLTLVTQLETANCSQTPAPVESLDVEGLVRRIEPYLRQILGPQVELHLDLDGQAARVCGSVVGLERLLMNLIMNARDALGRGPGRVRVVVATRPRQVLLAVEDDGTGVPAELRRQILEPFFTTRSETGGTGLGLAVVQQQVRAHGGRLEVAAAVAGGAAFRVLLPREA